MFRRACRNLSISSEDQSPSEISEDHVPVTLQIPLIKMQIPVNNLGFVMEIGQPFRHPSEQVE